MEEDGEANESADVYEEIDNEDNEHDQDSSKGEGTQIISNYCIKAVFHGTLLSYIHWIHLQGFASNVLAMRSFCLH